MNTICAISTPAGSGGVAMIRVSGNQAIAKVTPIYRPRKKGQTLATQLPYTLSYGEIIDPRNGNTIDDVMIALFKAPHSYTGEETIEITCHGSTYIQQQIIQQLILSGCTAAAPGEFTQRAFLNGKFDLSQAEAVADLIASTSAATHRLALNQMRGEFSSELSKLREKLLHFVSLIELELDFSEEEVEFANRTQLANFAHEISSKIATLAESFSTGNAIKNGIPVAIIGETNAGKSTLLNRLLHEEKAIVSDIHGTTRDTIEDTINLQGLTFRFIDTAGIRDTIDPIERMGIERTYNKIAQSTIVLWIVDASQSWQEIDLLSEKLLPLCADKKLLLLLNKTDTTTPAHIAALSHHLSERSIAHLALSARNDANLHPLEQQLISTASLNTNSNEVIVTNIRHWEALTHALSAIQRVEDGLTSNLTGDLLSQDLRACMHYLGEITGEITNEDILGNIFKNFCIGK